MRRWWAKASPEERRQRIDKAKASRAKTVRKERSRITFGFPQKTSLILVRNRHKSKRKSAYRTRLRRLGYIITRRSDTAYYTKDTTRRRLMEQRASRYGITIKPKEDGQRKDIQEDDTV